MFAVDVDEPFVLFDYAVYSGQPKPRSVSGLFGGVKGLEKMLERRFVHAVSRVADSQHDKMSGNRICVQRAVLFVKGCVVRFDC